MQVDAGGDGLTRRLVGDYGTGQALSESVKTREREARGFGAVKKVKGRKCHIAVDTQGFLLGLTLLIVRRIAGGGFILGPRRRVVK